MYAGIVCVLKEFKKKFFISTLSDSVKFLLIRDMHSFSSLNININLLYFKSKPSKEISVPKTGTPQASASITFTLMPAPVNNGEIKA